MKLSEELFLQEYDPSQFERPSVTVDILVMTVLERKLHLLLVRRSELPFLGKWALPGGFLKMDESAEEAAARIVLAKAGGGRQRRQCLAVYGRRHFGGRH